MLRLLLAAAMIAAAVPALAQRPNIVVIMTDEQPDVETLQTMPVLRREIADKGTVFTNSFVDFPLCSPSRASFFTGLAAHNHEVRDNRAEVDGGYAKFHSQGWEDHTIAVWLRQAGYRTAMIGKYLNQFPKAAGLPLTHKPPGWHAWLPRLGGDPYFKQRVNLHGSVFTSTEYSTDFFTRHAVRFIRRQARAPQPFFLLVTPVAAHGGHEAVGDFKVPSPAPRHRGKFARWPFPKLPSFNETNVLDKPAFVQARPRFGSQVRRDIITRYRLMRETLLSVDDMIRRVIAVLSDTGQLDNTIIMFMSDNGYMHGDHRLTGKSQVYENSIRIPLMMRGPGIQAGAVRRQLVNNLDVVATIVELAGATPDHDLDGRELTPVIADDAAPWRTALLVQGRYCDEADVCTAYSGVRTRRYVFAEHETAEQELYDLPADPNQMKNRVNAAGYQPLRGELSGILAALKACAGAGCWYDTPLTQGP